MFRKKYFFLNGFPVIAIEQKLNQLSYLHIKSLEPVPDTISFESRLGDDNRLVAELQYSKQFQNIKRLVKYDANGNKLGEKIYEHIHRSFLSTDPIR